MTAEGISPVLPLLVQGRFSPAWEMIKAPHHIWLMLLNFHSATCYEVDREGSGALPAMTIFLCGAGRLRLANSLACTPPAQLPVYWPSPAEREDPKLYAANVRQYMVGRQQRPVEQYFVERGPYPIPRFTDPPARCSLNFRGSRTPLLPTRTSFGSCACCGRRM